MESTCEVTATATAEVAAFIDPNGALQAAGLLTVTPEAPEAPAGELPQMIPLEALRLWRVASTDETRPALAGVLLERLPDGSTVAVATDGHRLITLPCPELRLPVTREPVMIPAAIARKLEQASKKRPSILLEAIDETHSTRTRYSFRNLFTGESIGCDRPDGQFPAWRQVLPTQGGFRFKLALDAALLKGICEALGGKDVATIELDFPMDADGELRPMHDMNPMVISANMGAYGATALLMPVRI